MIGLIGYSVPVFWLGLVGLLIFYARLDWVAGPGRLDVFYEDLVDPITGVILIAALAGEWDVFTNASSTSSCQPRFSAIFRSPTSRA